MEKSSSHRRELGSVIQSSMPTRPKRLHFLQMWVMPSVNGLKPSYATRKYPDDEKKDKLRVIVSKDGRDGSILIHNDVDVYASILNKGSQVTHKFQGVRRGYVHLPKLGGKITVNGQTLEEGDGAFVQNVEEVTFVGQSDAPSEFVFFDLV